MSSLVVRPLLRFLSWPQQVSGSNHVGVLTKFPSKNILVHSIQLTVTGQFICLSSLTCNSHFSGTKGLGRHGGWFGSASGFRTISRSCKDGKQQTSRSEAHEARSAAGDDLWTDARYENFEPWEKGGGVVHGLAEVDETVVVEPGAVVHANARIGPNSHISSGSVVGPHVVIGSDTHLGFNVSLQNCSVGDSCTLHNGVCVGQDGFGFTIDDKGQVVKKPQLLKVQIGHFVEIGANTCVDRGSWRDTVIGDHTKIDNMVQIGHNVVIGRCCLLCGQVGLAGSSTLGDYVVMGGKSGVSDHISVASKVRIAAKSAVTSHITEPGDYAGFPAVPVKEWRRQRIVLRKLGRRGDYEPL
ncbi:hypothetical protein R1flu_026771 [Riccia fluitans]|uniref:UDP-3-O-acylglucosamine N-acyltransferase 2, mitochondrial n=1 Tax=Riccia fluitans TaxID=41844 RepID=A0ABD1XGV9_9MARC